MDIVKRLRNHALPDPHDEREVLHAPLLNDAADEIDKLRDALETIASFAPGNGDVCEIIAQRARRALAPNG